MTYVIEVISIIIDILLSVALPLIIKQMIANHQPSKTNCFY